jgi:hypothetical protein
MKRKQCVCVGGTNVVELQLLYYILVLLNFSVFYLDYVTFSV